MSSLCQILQCWCWCLFKSTRISHTICWSSNLIDWCWFPLTVLYPVSELCELKSLLIYHAFANSYSQCFVGADANISQISDQPVNCVDWSPDKLGLLATASFDQKLRVVFVTKLNLIWKLSIVFVTKLNLILKLWIVWSWSLGNSFIWPKAQGRLCHKTEPDLKTVNCKAWSFGSCLLWPKA